MESRDALAGVLRTAEANRETDLADLLRLVAQPSISAQDIGVRMVVRIGDRLVSSLNYRGQVPLC